MKNEKLEAGKSYYNTETKCWFEAEECECCEKIVLGPNAVTANKQPPNTIATTIELYEELVYSDELGGCVCETCGNEAICVLAQHRDFLMEEALKGEV